MKKIVDRKLYNTATAEAIHDWSNELSYGDFRWCSETLYRTAKGTFFLYGEGGPLSPYAEPVGNMSTDGSDIRPLTEEQAVDWLESHDGTKPLLALFPDKVSEA